jgi:hypothetical protein
LGEFSTSSLKVGPDPVLLNCEERANPNLSTMGSQLADLGLKKSSFMVTS